MRMNGPKNWPPGTKAPKEPEIIDAEFEDIAPPDRILKITDQSGGKEKDGPGGAGVRDDSEMVRTDFEDGASVRINPEFARGEPQRNPNRKRRSKHKNTKGAKAAEQPSPESQAEGSASRDADAALTDEAERLRAEIWQRLNRPTDASSTPADEEPLMSEEPAGKAAASFAALRAAAQGEKPTFKEARSALEAVVQVHPYGFGDNLPVEERAEESRAENTRVENIQPSTPEGRYEERVARFAEKHKIVEERTAMLDAEKAYKEQLVARYKKRGLISSKEEEAARKAYLEASFAWRGKLASVAEGLEDVAAVEGKTLGRSEKKEALVFRKRDTILRAAALKADAKAEGLAERSKTLVGQIEKWSLAVPRGLIKGYVGATDWIGGGRYGKAVRIAAGAGIATALAIGATPVAASGAALTFVIYGARGVAGLAAGMAAAKGVGGLYQRFFGSRKQASIREGMHAAEADVSEYAGFLNKFRSSNTRQRQAEKEGLQTFAAIAAGGANSILTSPFAHELLERIGALETVEAAQKNTESPAPAKPTQPVAASAAVEAPAAQPQPVEIATRSIEAGSGQGFNHLFANLNTEGLDANAPVIKELESLSPTELSQRVGAIVDGRSETMYGGEKLILQQNPSTGGYELVFERPGEEPITVMKAGPDGEVVYQKLPAPEGTPDVVTTQTKAPEAASEQTYEAPEATSEPSTDTVEAGGTEADLKAAPPPPERTIEDALAELSGDMALAPVENTAGADRTIEDALRELQGDAPTSENPTGASDRTIEDALTEMETSTSFQNGYGVEITPDKAAVYESRVSGTGEAYRVVSGGTPEQMADVARAFARENPGTPVYMELQVRDPLTGAPITRLDAWSATPGSEATRTMDVLPDLDAENRVRPSLNPDTFVRRMQ